MCQSEYVMLSPPAPRGSGTMSNPLTPSVSGSRVEYRRVPVLVSSMTSGGQGGTVSWTLILVKQIKKDV